VIRLILGLWGVVTVAAIGGLLWSRRQRNKESFEEFMEKIYR